jgi:hypothetical protein
MSEVGAQVVVSPRFDLPVTDGESARWWAAVAEGQLLLERCRACGNSASYPRSFCPKCWSDDVEWVPTAGMGVVYTFSVVRVNDQPPFAGRLPYVVAVVDLDEGPRLMASLAGIEPDDVRIGLRVVFRPRALDAQLSAPEFMPIGAS